MPVLGVAAARSGSWRAAPLPSGGDQPRERQAARAIVCVESEPVTSTNAMRSTALVAISALPLASAASMTRINPGPVTRPAGCSCSKIVGFRSIPYSPTDASARPRRSTAAPAAPATDSITRTRPGAG